MSNYKLPEDEKMERYPDFRPHDSKVIMVCGNGSGITIPTAHRGGYGNHQALVAGTLSLNTAELRCPTVKIDFSSIINYQVKSWDGEYLIRLTFQLSKACAGGHKIPLNTWIYEKEVDNSLRLLNDGVGPQAASNGCPPPPIGPEVEITNKDSFSFTYCECNPCPDCCLYVVEVVDVDADKVKCLSLTNVGINAVATSNHC